MIRKSALLWTVLVLLGCTNHQPSPFADENAAYYWRTDFVLDSAEQAFMKQYDIRTLYCRYFDVVLDKEHGAIPNATLTFTSAVPDGINFVPTVFITEACMHQPDDSLAVRLVRRVVQMNETNDVKGVKELQIDCDYTRRSRETFYHFLEQVRAEARRHGMQLSTTIRLHQLSMPAPPADYGVLMLYNTGDPQRFDERNPILDLRDVQPYLRHLNGYELPLCAAYPVFLWQREVHGVYIEHTAEASEILRVKQAVEQRRDELRHRIITYHLSEENINRYNTKDYEAFYHH